MSNDDVVAAKKAPGMPVWLGRIGEVPPGTERLENVPWEVFEPHEAQAQRNHGQSLKRLKERGGLSVVEAACILSDESYRNMPLVLAIHRVASAVEAIRKLNDVAAARGWKTS